MSALRRSKPPRLILKVTLAGIVSILLGLAASFLTSMLFATSPLPARIRPFAPYIFPAFGVLVFLSLCIAIWQAASGSSDSSHSNSANIGFPCPLCHQSWMYVHGGKGGRVSFQCGNCHQPAVATYDAGKLTKLFLAGVGVIVGAEAIAHILNTDPATVTDTFGAAYDGIFGQ